jgi:uncharacterized protein YjiS (DUF1127 family)
MISVLLSSAATDVWRALVAVATAIAGGAVNALKEWRYRNDIHKLHSMSDRQLSDIGLPRSRIEEAVRGGLSRAPAPRGKLRSLFHP